MKIKKQETQTQLEHLGVKGDGCVKRQKMLSIAFKKVLGDNRSRSGTSPQCQST